LAEIKSAKKNLEGGDEMNIRISFPKIIISLFILSTMLFVSTGFGLASEGLLDGKVFTGPTGKMGKDATETDELRFENGKLYSVGCADWGFGWGAYSTEVKGNGINFEAVTTSPKDGKIVWSGIVSGDTIDATYIWTKKSWYGERKQEKWFKGNAK
jgi:hypothetical protein